LFTDPIDIAEVAHATSGSFDDIPVSALNALSAFYKLVAEKRDTTSLARHIARYKLGASLNQDKHNLTWWLTTNELPIGNAMFDYAINSAQERLTVHRTRHGCDPVFCVDKKAKLPQRFIDRR
jgi:hypothetical protein